AEYLVSNLIEEGVGINNILAVFDGQLKRNWSKDISRTIIEEFENGDEVLAVHLNRAGIYDSLPEALFHSFSSGSSVTGDEMAKESVKLKAEEKDIRLFFKPLENEIFFQGVRLATKESQVFSDIYSDSICGLIPDFWRIDENISSKFNTKLVKLLPFVHHIVGNYELTAKSLEFIINEKVSIDVSHSEPERISEKNEQVGISLGECSLGEDTVMGSRISGFVGRLIFNIGPLENSEPSDFFNNGEVDRLLKSFYNYFIPIELDVETELFQKEEKSKFVLSCDSEQEPSFLGYNSVL
ncbi:MAG: type VI secretion system baseplate subunit TssG, partial [Draconibacterium sp.]|nr:type VI secretion system baseplate subunit TssG [Draconibacterium sp.]